MNISRFFIDRPIFAAVIAVVISIIGVAAYPLLPLSQYPEIAPPTISARPTIPAAISGRRFLSSGDMTKSAKGATN